MSNPAKKSKTTVIPCLPYRNAPAAIAWLCQAFGFEKHLVLQQLPTITPVMQRRTVTGSPPWSDPISGKSSEQVKQSHLLETFGIASAELYRERFFDTRRKKCRCS